MTSTASLVEQALAFDLESFFMDHQPRLAHMRGAAAFALDLGHCWALQSQDQNFLERSALLHDLGYAPILRTFNFHPLDGAIFLEKWQEHAFVIEGVLRHSQAERRALDFPLVAKEYARRRPLAAAAWLVRAVTLADWRVAGVGGPVSFGQRLQDIISRNPDNPDKAQRATAMVEEVRGWFLQSMVELRGHQLPWIFCDIDNTLIRPGDALPEANKAGIRAYTAAGGQLSLATGKHPRSIAPLVASLGLTTAQVAINGACVLRGHEVDVLADLGETAGLLRSKLEAWGLPIALYRKEGIEAGSAWQPWLDGLFERYGEILPVRQPLADGPVLKILCVVDSEDKKFEQELRALAASLDIHICRSDQHFLEFLPRQGHKGAAVRQVMSQANWPVLNSLAIGDNENDATMFAVCGACAAVKNATRAARLGADWIIGSCLGSGVGQLLDLVREQGGWNGLAGLNRGEEM